MKAKPRCKIADCQRMASYAGLCTAHYSERQALCETTHPEAWRTDHITKFISRSWGKMEQRNYERTTPRYAGQR